MRLLTYNIQAAIGAKKTSDYIRHGYRQFFQTRAKTRTLVKLGQFIKDFDVVCLQEVDLGGRRSGFQSQLDVLSEVSGLTHIATQTNRIVGKTSIHGNATLSRYPIESVTDHKLPGRIPGRGLLECQIEGVTFFNTHLSLGTKAQTEQLGFIAEQIHAKTRSIMVGDLNCRSTQAALEDFAQKAGLSILTTPTHKTYPAWSPRQDLDHILVSDDFHGLEATVLNPGLSDHRPVTTTLPT